jgi:ferrous iron transport protein A
VPIVRMSINPENPARPIACLGGSLAVELLIPLSLLKRGQSAYVGQIDGRADHVHRLRELGLAQGSKIEMFRPGNPCIIRMAGNKVCIRSDDLLRVLVRPNGTPPA